MAHTDADLRELLAERAATVPAALGDSAVSRVAAVDRRVRVIRRRRTAGASLGVVVLLLVGGLSGLFSHDDQQKTAPVPAYQQKVAGGLLPRYNGGGEATAYTTFGTNEKREATFTFTPTSWSFLVSLSCDKDMPQSRMVSVEINGHPMMAGSCSRGLNTGGPAYGLERDRAQSLGIRLGEPSTVQTRVVQAVKAGTVPPERQPTYHGAMPDFRVAVGIYSPMPIDDYPFPPRPQKLESLTGSGSIGHGRVLGTVDSRSVGANGSGTVVTTLTAQGIATEVYAVAPGAVTITVNATIIDMPANWSWGGTGFGGLVLKAGALRHLGIDVKTGDKITIGFSGERFTVPGWRAQVHAGK